MIHVQRITMYSTVTFTIVSKKQQKEENNYIGDNLQEISLPSENY